MKLFDRQLVVVTGKGGVGRTTLSAALAQAAADAGKRVCVAELYGLAHVARLYGLPDRSYVPRTIAPGVDTMSLTPFECMSDFGRRKLKIGALSRLIFQNRVARAFLDGVPGLHDLVQLGKIENLISEPLDGDPHYDLIVLDAPATGHGQTLLAAAHTMRDMTRVGPFADLAAIIEAFLADAERTAFVLATLPEELPVSEAIQFVQGLGPDKEHLAAIIVNQVLASPFPTRPRWEQVRTVLADEPRLGPLIELAERELERHESQVHALDLLEQQTTDVLAHPLPILRVPRVEAWQITPEEIGSLANAVVAQMEAA